METWNMGGKVGKVVEEIEEVLGRTERKRIEGN